MRSQIDKQQASVPAGYFIQPPYTDGIQLLSLSTAECLKNEMTTSKIVTVNKLRFVNKIAKSNNF